MLKYKIAMHNSNKYNSNTLNQKKQNKTTAHTIQNMMH